MKPESQFVAELFDKDKDKDRVPAGSQNGKGHSRGRPVTPKQTFVLELTHQCNRRCLYCYNGCDRRPSTTNGPLLDADAWDRIAESLTRFCSPCHFQISGGEPLLRPDFLEVTRRIASHGQQLSLLTDGGLITTQMATALAELRIAPVQPTLLAANRKTHDEIKGSASFDSTVVAIQMLLRAQVPVSVSFVCTAMNYNYFKETIELCFALGVRRVAWSRLCSVGTALHNHKSLMPDSAMVRDNLDTALWARNTLKMNVMVAIGTPRCVATAAHTQALHFGPCAMSAGKPGYTVDPWGNVRACSVSNVLLGNLNQISMAEIDADARANFLPQASTLPELCLRCPDASICMGGCRASAVASTGSWGGLDPLLQ